LTRGHRPVPPIGWSPSGPSRLAAERPVPSGG
jgi:hypothetical protein